MALDLSNIPAREIPEKKDKITILGVEKDVTYKPLTGANRLNLWSTFRNDGKGYEATIERVYIVLEHAVGMEKEDISRLIELDWEAALDLTGRCIMFTNEFEDSVNKETAAAEKN